ncbi:matrix metalloproteinase-9 [Lepeophtheirus salmonis]|uniref:matrix metalloproteinase-9 n=1 Tax=Lepeophtheirus salmonis TaxID=72036 RepID=UPI001AE3A2B3|nr:epididymal sperm-binding protein 1-like [Lepeophtheirus salmonis]
MQSSPPIEKIYKFISERGFINQFDIQSINMKTFLIATLLVAQYASSVLGCQTTTGENCIFPFTYREMTFSKCSKADYDKYWCATSVNSDGSFKTFGDCNSNCPMEVHSPTKECLTVGGIPCKFPFSYNGNTYSKCTSADNNGVKWCPINKYPGSSEAFHYEECNMTSQCEA